MVPQRNLQAGMMCTQASVIGLFVALESSFFDKLVRGSYVEVGSHGDSRQCLMASRLWDP